MREGDVKAPDGFLLGGERLVRKDGTILFQRGWWKVPDEWAGKRCWVHCTDSGAGDLEVAPPGWEHIYKAQAARVTIFAKRTDRPDAKSGWRRADKLAWANRPQTPTA